MNIETILDIKRKNFKSIIDYIRFREDWQKKDVSKDLGLSFATVSSMINDMMEIGMVKTTQHNQKAVGRAPKTFSLVENRFLMIVISIYRTNRIMITAINLKRQIMALDDFLYDDCDDIESFIDLLVSYYHDFMQSHEFIENEVIGIGIVTRGIYNSKTGCVVGTYWKLLQNQPIGRLLSARVRKMVWVGNDVDFAAYDFAYRNNIENLFYVYCGSGLGLGVVNAGRPLAGASGYTSEISHTPCGELGVVCPFCHHTDCLQMDMEQAGFISKYYQRIIQSNEVTDDMWREFVNNVEKSEPKAVDVVKQNGRILSRIYSLLTGVLHPEIAVLSGIPKTFYEIMSPIINYEMNSRELQPQRIHLQYDPNFTQTVAFGAAETVYHHWQPNLDNLKSNYTTQSADDL